MRIEPYSEEVRSRFAEPAHAGTLDDGISVLEAAQEIRLELSARAEGNRLAVLRFRVRGCPHVIAAADAFCAQYEGRDASELEDFSADPITETLEVPVEKTGRILVLEDAVRSLGQAIKDSR